MEKEELEAPFNVQHRPYVDDEDATDTSSIESSPLVHKNKPDNSFSFLASANFSTDSIAEVDEDALRLPSTPTNINTGNILNFSHNRRFSVSSLTSPTAIMRPNPSTKQRPKSAYYDEENTSFNSMGLYPNSNAQSPVNSTFNGLSSAGRSRRYIPIIAPPHSSRSGSPTRSTSPTRANKHFRSKSPVRRGSSPTKQYQPFNFKSQEVSLNNNLSVKPAHRKGHKYKHSSVSMNYFQEPTPSNLDTEYLSTIPDLYPIPTLKESVASITKDQKFKVGWSIIHLMLSLIVFVSGHRIHVPELSTLAHLIFYDSLGSMVVILVEIMSNFEVWNNASILYPFGLGRLEVLIGFGLGASLIMVGFDLLSHIFEEFVIVFFNIEEAAHSHGSHHVHRDDDHVVSRFVYYSVLLLTVGVTVLTSQYILASKKIDKIIKEKSHNRNISNIGGILDELEPPPPKETKFLDRFDEITDILTKNPTYVLTLLYTFFLILSPVVSEVILKQIEVDVNELASLIISLLFCLTGLKLVKALGGILLLSYPSSTHLYEKLKRSILNEIMGLDAFKNSYKIENLFITKFNYDTFVVGMMLSMHGSSVDDEARLRFEISRLITRKLKKRQRNNFKLEITIDITRV